MKYLYNFMLFLFLGLIACTPKDTAESETDPAAEVKKE